MACSIGENVDAMSHTLRSADLGGGSYQSVSLKHVQCDPAMVPNPYTPPVSPLVSKPVQVIRGTPSGRVRLSVFFANCGLLLIFPPVCCPCGLGPIGFIVQPYFMLMGCPTILAAFFVPSIVDSHRSLFLAAYLANYVIAAYLIGEITSRVLARRAVRTSET